MCRLYTLGSFGLSKVRYALIGMEGPRSIIEHGATKQEIGQKKRRPIRNGSGAWILSGLQVVKSYFLSPPKAPRNAPSSASSDVKSKTPPASSRLGSVEPAAERARELAVHIQAVRVIRVLSHNRCLGRRRTCSVNGTFKRGQAGQGRRDLGLGRSPPPTCGSVHQRNVPVAVLILSLHSGNPVAIVRGIAVVRHIAPDQSHRPIVLDEANAEIGEFLGTAPSQLPREQPTHRSGCACTQLPREGRPLPATSSGRRLRRHRKPRAVTSTLVYL